MDVHCIACKSFALTGPLAPFGFGVCDLESGDYSGYSSFSAHYPRECARFSRDAPERVEEREAWLAAQKEMEKPCSN